MKRRVFVTGFAGLLAAPLVAEAQQAGKAPRIGFLAGGSSVSAAPFVEEFREGLRELGDTEGRNIIIEYRWAEGKVERLPDLAADLVGRKVDLYLRRRGAADEHDGGRAIGGHVHV